MTSREWGGHANLLCIVPIFEGSRPVPQLLKQAHVHTDEPQASRSRSLPLVPFATTTTGKDVKRGSKAWEKKHEWIPVLIQFEPAPSGRRTYAQLREVSEEHVGFVEMNVRKAGVRARETGQKVDVGLNARLVDRHTRNVHETESGGLRLPSIAVLLTSITNTQESSK